MYILNKSVVRRRRRQALGGLWTGINNDSNNMGPITIASIIIQLRCAVDALSKRSVRQDCCLHLSPNSFGLGAGKPNDLDPPTCTPINDPQWRNSRNLRLAFCELLQSVSVSVCV